MLKEIQVLSKKFLVTILLICIVLSVVICGSAASSDAEQRYNLIVGGGGLGGTYFPLAGAIARVLTKELPNVNASAQSTGAGVENIILIERGEIELGLTQNDLAEYASKKQYMFDAEYKGGAAIARLYPEVIQIMVKKDSGINSISDIKGKRVSVGYAGSGMYANAMQILELFGIVDDIKAEQIDNVDAGNRMRDGLIDVIFRTTSAPNAGILELAFSVDIDVLNFSDEELKKLTDEYPFFSEHTIPANTYQGQTEDVRTVSVHSVLICQKALDEELVYNLTKTIWEQREQLVSMIAALKDMDPENPLLGITIEVHPGAKKYYEEIGIWKK